MATYLHPDKLVSVERALARKKARKRIATINQPRRKRKLQKAPALPGDNLVRNLAAHLMTVQKARRG